jgi:hypothetical protein
MEFAKSFGVGLSTLVIALWCVGSLVWFIGIIFTAGAVWVTLPLWVNIVALVPWTALVVAVIALFGDDLRNP